jgi:fatty acid desaturase
MMQMHYNKRKGSYSYQADRPLFRQLKNFLAILLAVGIAILLFAFLFKVAIFLIVVALVLFIAARIRHFFNWRW